MSSTVNAWERVYLPSAPRSLLLLVLLVFCFVELFGPVSRGLPGSNYSPRSPRLPAAAHRFGMISRAVLRRGKA